ncbi:SAM-dependent methyltransferase [Tumebacillus algifaecis]|uniref:SAM-dependent methyltransferase n=1 Tax=Tumebacillus algifaecis TaxID=1214604 RepID=A0A223D5Q7_9BACL|nr:class I SAM-dependent methyltransferase [Tumebacillus algifaecis]ASS76746.1 SAM-dependent methyltransferase [Tumebacillus algifaecis]
MNNHWHERFNTADYVFGKEPNAFLASIAHRLPAEGKWLAIAEGEGRNAVFLAEQGHRVTTWDLAESGLQKTKQLAAERNVAVATEWVDLSNAVWQPAQWDGIVCIFGHFPEALRNRTLQGVKTAVKPGGYYLTEVYSKYQLPYKSGGPKDEALLYQAEDLLQAFADWKIVHFFMGEVVREEGTGHQGLSHVIQLLAQKQ